MRMVMVANTGTLAEKDEFVLIDLPPEVDISKAKDPRKTALRYASEMIDERDSRIDGTCGLYRSEKWRISILWLGIIVILAILLLGWMIRFFDEENVVGPYCPYPRDYDVDNENGIMNCD